MIIPRVFFSFLLLPCLLTQVLANQGTAAHEPSGTAAPSLDQGAGAPSPSTSILRVNVSNQSSNFRLPWKRNQPSGKRGLGALLKKNRVLVTAELVANATYIDLELPGSGRKLTAQVGIIDYESNLAVLHPTDDPDGFFDGLIPLRLSDGCAVGDQLEVWQIEPNGTPVTTTVEISQVEVGSCFVPGHFLLQYKASGNVQYRSGTFTLPVIKDGKICGVLFRYSSKNEVSTILPSPIIQHFLTDAEDGFYDGFPNLGIEYAKTLDDQFRSYLGIDDETGVYVSSVRPQTSADTAGIEAGDVLLSIDGHAIDSRGNYDDPAYGLLNLSHLVRGNAQVGDESKIVVLRNGAKKTLKATLQRKAPENYLVDPYIFDRGGNFLIMGGLLFQELSRPYLESFGSEWRSRAPFKLVYAMRHPEKYEEEGRRKVVFLAGILPTRSVQGYEGIGGTILKSVNGRPIRDIRDLDVAFNFPTDGVHEIQFEDFPKIIWLDDALAQEDNFLHIPQRFRIQERMRLD